MVSDDFYEDAADLLDRDPDLTFVLLAAHPGNPTLLRSVRVPSRAHLEWYKRRFADTVSALERQYAEQEAEVNSQVPRDESWAYDPLRIGNARPECLVAPGLDMAQYITQGGMMALSDLRDFDVPWEELKRNALLDFGCGTGRVSRIMSAAFLTVVGYDPSERILSMAPREVKETKWIKFGNVRWVGSLEAEGLFRFAISHNVFEHLGDAECRKAWQLLCHHLVPGAFLVLDFNPQRNPCLVRVLCPELLQEPNGVFDGVLRWCGQFRESMTEV